MSELKFQREDNGFVRVQIPGFNDAVFTVEDWTGIIATVSAGGDTITQRGRARDVHTLIVVVDEPKDELEPVEAVAFLNDDNDDDDDDDD